MPNTLNAWPAGLAGLHGQLGVLRVRNCCAPRSRALQGIWVHTCWPPGCHMWGPRSSEGVPPKFPPKGLGGALCSLCACWVHGHARRLLRMLGSCQIWAHRGPAFVEKVHGGAAGGGTGAHLMDHPLPPGFIGDRLRGFAGAWAALAMAMLHWPCHRGAPYVLRCSWVVVATIRDVCARCSKQDLVVYGIRTCTMAFVRSSGLATPHRNLRMHTLGRAKKEAFVDRESYTDMSEGLFVFSE